MSRSCAEPTCCKPLPLTGPYRRFCPGGACKRKYQHRALARGQKLYEEAIKWRTAKRSHQKGAKNPRNIHFGYLTWMLDQWLYDDKIDREKAKAALA